MYGLWLENKSNGQRRAEKQKQRLLRFPSRLSFVICQHIHIYLYNFPLYKFSSPTRWTEKKHMAFKSVFKIFTKTKAKSYAKEYERHLMCKWMAHSPMAMGRFCVRCTVFAARFCWHTMYYVHFLFFHSPWRAGHTENDSIECKASSWLSQVIFHPKLNEAAATAEHFQRKYA